MPNYMDIQDDSSGPLFWGDIHESFYGISQAGVVNTNRDSVKYTLTPISNLIPRSCFVSYSCVANPGGSWEIYYFVDLRRGDILNPYHYIAWGNRTYTTPPQPQCLIGYWDFGRNVVTSGDIATPRLQFRQASYSLLP
jgi:hypothetical protein